ncbi:MAG: PAS domain-containing protein [Acidobacteria bacterium]|nr:PAS domain-containing protein [Acidobacteriota bacterium]
MWLFRFFRIFILALLTLAGIGIGILNLREQQTFRLPEDGVLWVDSEKGVTARTILEASPAEAGGLQAGDLLLRLNGYPIQNAVQVSQYLFQAHIGEVVRYELSRQGMPAESEVVLAAQERSAVRRFLQFVGVLYLALGLFVLARRFQAPHAIKFYLFCLASFVLFVFSYTGKLDSFDWTVYWASVSALVLQPALFAHFCVSFPRIQLQTGKRSRRLWWMGIYGVAALLGIAHIATALGTVRFTAISLVEVRWLLDRLEMGYLVAMFLLGIGFLAYNYRKANSRLLRKQIGWVLGGAIIGVVPFASAYAVPYFLGFAPNAWMSFSALSLAFLPIAFSYAIVRHRLLDVDVLLGRGVAYTLATGVLVGTYLGVAVLIGDFFRTNFPASGTIGLLGAVIATGLLFQPLQRWIQGKLEQYFLHKRYDYREALLAFGQELSSDTELGRMIHSLLRQLVQTLKVRQAAVFLVTEAEPPSFVLREAVGMEGSNGLDSRADYGFLHLLNGTEPSLEEPQNRLFFRDFGLSIERELGSAASANPAWRETIIQNELHYYFACRAKNHLVAVLGLGKTQESEFLSGEDASLLETLAGYLAIAIENVRLMESLAVKATQYERLQQFSENILESINVGLLALDLEDRIEAVNTPLQLIYPLPVSEWRGKKLGEILPSDLLEQVDHSREDGGIQNIYHYRILNRAGEERVLNIAVAPLLSKNCDCIGRLMIFEDVTDQVAREAQLLQAEKLSSVGLLAAGVAHEVNTPLTVISTQAQMLAKQLRPGDKAAKILEKITSQTFRASEIVNSLLNFSRTQGASFTAVELNKVISETLLLLDHQFKASRINVEHLLDPTLPAISGNIGKLQQVFLNLFLNAKDAMPEGGRLRVVTWAEDSIVRVEVSDSGVGIPPEHLRRIFDPFFTTKSAGRGTGLGLAVSYGIIQEHSGKIRAESHSGLGTRFRLEFPALKKAVHV